MTKFVFVPLLLLGLVSCSQPVSSSVSSSSSTEESTSSNETSSSSSDESSSTSSSSSSSEVSSSSSSSSPSTESSASSSSSSSSSSLTYDDPAGDPELGNQFYLNHIGDIYQAWEHYRGDGITIAVIDVGFKPDHPDFVYADGKSKISSLSASFSQNGGQTVTRVGADKVVDLGNSHGTFCAGVAAAAINSKGVVGVAPNAELMLLKTDAKPKSINAAFRYAADNGARVVTISIGSYYNYGGDLQNDGSDLSSCFDEAVAYCRNKGTVVVSAAGNGGEDGQPTEYTFPGATPGVIGVGGLAANKQDVAWTGSSYNSSSQYRFIDVMAPAEGMYGCCHYDNKLYDGGWKGTSFASPQVAGMAALYFQKYPTATVDNFESALYQSCHPMSGDHYGAGRVDVGKLLGLNGSGTFKITVKTPWNSCNAYAWNLETEKENQGWPGIAMTKESGGFTCTLDASVYEHVIFNNGNNQTIDLALSSFRFGKAYDLFNSDSFDGNLIGRYS